MNTRRDQVIVQVNEDELQDGRRLNASFIHHHYHAPVNVNHIRVGHAYNPNFGANSGHINQTMQLSTAPTQWRGPCTPQPTDVCSLLNPILDASHTRNMKLSPPNSQCLPETRTKVIQDIRRWADSNPLDTHPHILWIFGYAGCGKSAIAHEIAKNFARQGRLAACFVFFRGSGDRSSAVRFATTVASQIAAAVPGTESVIERTVRKSPGLLSLDTTSLSDQFEHLVYQPIIAVASQNRTPLLIVLDGVDECQDREDMATFIENMIDFFNRHPRTPLRFLITSRVEDNLHQVLHSSNQVQLLDLVEQTSDADIAAALDSAIEKEQRGQVLSRDDSWPSAEDRAELVEHIGGSFIFLATTVKRLFDRNSRDGLTPMERLPMVLSMNPDFDALYEEILTPWEHLPHFQGVISTIALAFEPLSVAELADILSMKTVDVVNVLINLHAIIQVPGDDRTPVTLWHTSLRDYLCVEARSGSLSANPAHHQRLAYRCISVAAASVNATRTPSSEYARSYAIGHLAKLADTMDSDPELFVGELHGVMGELQAPIFKDSQTALDVACRAGYWKVVCGLVHANVNINSRFHERGDGVVVALHAACLRQERDLIHFLLDNGADPNIVSPREDVGGFNDGTPLALAASSENVELVTRFLECGADPNLQGGVFGTALQAACVGASLEIVNVLLNHGADPTLPGGDWGSALHACARQDFDSCARALLMHKADPNIQDHHGRTPFFLACLYGKVKVTECLLEFKADTNIRDDKGQTALQVARKRQKTHVVQLLLRHGILE